MEICFFIVLGGTVNFQWSINMVPDILFTPLFIHMVLPFNDASRLRFDWKIPGFIVGEGV